MFQAGDDHVNEWTKISVSRRFKIIFFVLTFEKSTRPQAVEDSEMEKKKKLKAEQIATLKERLEYAASQEETADLRAQIRDALKSMSELQVEQARELQSQAQALAGAAGDPKSGAGDSERPSAVHGAGGDAHH